MVCATISASSNRLQIELSFHTCRVQEVTVLSNYLEMEICSQAGNNYFKLPESFLNCNCKQLTNQKV